MVDLTDVYAQFPWESDETKSREWAYAKSKLKPNGRLLSNGTKLRRKDPKNADIIKHSFIIVDGRILAMAPKGDYLGRGTSGRVKLAEDENGGLWALKININKYKNNTEEKIGYDLGLTLHPTIRNNYYKRFFSSQKSDKKVYLPYVYLGVPLNKYLTDPKWIKATQEERFDLAIKIALALHAFHSGQQSKTNTRYSHGDLFFRNMTINNKGEVHLIDVGSASECDINSSLADEVKQLVRILKEVFTSKMYNSNKELKFLLLRIPEESDELEDLPPPPSSALDVAIELQRIKYDLDFPSDSKLKPF